MKNIVIEGPDGSGKSTLAHAINRVLAWPIYTSKGPDKYPGDTNDRIADALKYETTIFDRHPAVSGVIYSRVRGNSPDYVNSSLVRDFYQTAPIIIYCRSFENAPIENHVLKHHDTEEHIRMITEKTKVIHTLYDLWAVEHALIIRRSRAVTSGLILSLVLGALSHDHLL